MDVSIIVPMYNVAPYLVRCLDSVASQDYAGTLECIIVDDCGQDNSREIADHFIASYVGNVSFCILEHEGNKGLSCARNTGLLAAQGDFVYFLDSDDELSPNCISLLMHQVDRHPEVEMVQGYISCDYSSFFNMTAFDNIDYVEDARWIRQYFYTWQGPRLNVNAWNKLVRRSFLVENNLFQREGIMYEDELWMFHVCQYLTKLAFVHKETYIHYRTGDSLLARIKRNSPFSIRSTEIIFSEILSDVQSPFARYQLYTYCLDCLKQKDNLPHSRRILYKFLNKSVCHGMFMTSAMLFCLLFVPQKRGYNFFYRHTKRINDRRSVHMKRLF